MIAAMTVGKDVSVLFAEVLNCMQTDNIGLKKLVYLYLINYAKSQPDLVILAVNTFVKVWRRDKLFFQTFILSIWLTGFSRSKSSCKGSSGAYNGMYPGQQDHRISLWSTSWCSAGIDLYSTLTKFKYFVKDSEAYVRKTAAICVAKLFDINPTLVIDRYFFLPELLTWQK